jgi:S-formylglutathione hydrolase FrmB
MNQHGIQRGEVKATALGLLALVLLFAPNYTAAQDVLHTEKAVASRDGRPTQVATRETLTANSLGGAALQYRVLLPADYESSPRRYPVLYLLHGAGGDENDWSSRTDLASYIAKYNLIVVMPAVGNTWYANSASDEKARYEDVIIRDLIPHIDAKYRTIGNWHGRAIAGLSMGGFGALKFALRYPHLFVFAASFSGAFDAPRTDIIANATDERSKNLLQALGEKGSETRRQNDVFQLLAKISPGTRVRHSFQRRFDLRIPKAPVM